MAREQRDVRKTIGNKAMVCENMRDRRDLKMSDVKRVQMMEVEQG